MTSPTTPEPFTEAVDAEAVVDELDVDTEAPLDEVEPAQPDAERIVPEPEEPEPGA